MMLTIGGLPLTVKYPEIKSLIRQHCGISDFILDLLLPDSKGLKKVRIGVSDDRDGSTLIKMLDGYIMGSSRLTVLPVGKSEAPPVDIGHPSYNQPQNTYNQGNVQWEPNNQQQPSQEPLNSGPWAENTWVPNQQSYGYQQPGPAGRLEDANKSRSLQQVAGMQKNRSFGNLRNVELVEGNITAPQQRASNTGPNQAYKHDKPATIMKDNFQGPSQHDTSPIWEKRDSRNSYFDRGQGGNQRPEGRQMNPRGFDRSPDHGMSQKRPQDMRHSSPGRRPTSPARPGQRPGSPPRPRIRAISPNRLLQRPVAFSEDMSGRRNPFQRGLSPNNRPLSPSKRMSPPRQGRQFSPSRRAMSPGRMPLGRQEAPVGRQFSDRRMSPGRKMSPGRGGPPGRPKSPMRRLVSPGRRNASPGRRPMSPGRRFTSPGRRPISPGRRLMSPGRRPVSPGRRPISPGRRPMSPGKRPMSPGRRPMSPGRRPMSPGRRVVSPGRSGPRFSPRRDIDDMFHKQGRHAHEAAGGAPKPMYSDDYRPKIQEKLDGFAMTRKVEPLNSPWQGERDEAAALMKNQTPGHIQQRLPHDGSRDKGFQRDVMRSGMDRFSPGRRSRSPNRRNSPKHQYRRSSSLSPHRRPWRNDLEPPPPPTWPGQQERSVDPFQKRPRPDLEPPKQTKSPVWERPIELQRGMRPEVERRYEERKDNFPEPMRRGPSPRRGFKPNEESFVPVNADFRRHSPNLQNLDMDLDRSPNYKDVNREIDDIAHRHGKFGGISAPEIFRQVENIDKDFDDIHRRALEFRKKAEAVKRHRDESRKFDVAPKEAYHNVDPLYDSSRRFDGDRRDSRRDPIELHRDQRSRSHEHSPRTREVRRTHEGMPRSQERRSTERRPISREAGPSSREDKIREPAKPVRRLHPSIRAKRDKAVEEIVEKILKRQTIHAHIGVQKRVFEELKHTIGLIINDMFEEKDVSFIEIIVKFGSKYNQHEEDKLYREALRTVLDPVNQDQQAKKRSADSHEGSAKMAKLSSEPVLSAKPRADDNRPMQIDHGLNVNPNPFNMMPTMLTGQFDPSQLGVQMSMMMGNPMMVPAPSALPTALVPLQTPVEEHNKPNEYNMYLCKEDFEPLTAFQAEYLRKFIFSAIYQAAKDTSGWTPNFIIKGLQSSHRFEMSTTDVASKEWLTNLNFDDFKYFQVLVYTKEELWYERAAIWLPGHSTTKNLNPLEKIKLQNRHLKEMNFSTWKLVKKIITPKGTRIYVDMPPSSARALEKIKMILNYELQRVTVYLKAVAIDKEVFDMGLKEISLDENKPLPDLPMPSIPDTPDLIKIALKGNKLLSLQQAKKIKDIIIYRLFKHLQSENIHALKYLNYGFCQPGYLGILPEDADSKRWLLNTNIGKLNKHPIAVIGCDYIDNQFIRMEVTKIPTSAGIPCIAKVHNALKAANQGVPGLNINKWKPVSLKSSGRMVIYLVDMDLESVETMKKIKYILEYEKDWGGIQECPVRHPKSRHHLQQEIAKIKAELTDKYDVANMDLDSGEESDDDDVILIE